MQKFKHGQRVVVETKDHGTIKDAKISIDEDGEIYLCQNKMNGFYAAGKLGYEYSWKLKKDFTGNNITSIKPFLKSFSNPEVGDRYKDGDGDTVVVLGIAGRLIGVSLINMPDSSGSWWTKEMLIDCDYTIIQDEEEVEEVTMEQVCEKFGRTIKIKKK